MAKGRNKPDDPVRDLPTASRDRWNTPLNIDGATGPDGIPPRKRSPREALEWSIRYMRRQIHDGAVSVLTHVEAQALLDRLRDCERFEQELEAARAQLERLERR